MREIELRFREGGVERGGSILGLGSKVVRGFGVEGSWFLGDS